MKRKGFTVELNSTNSIDKGFLAFPRVQNEYGPGENNIYAFGDGRGAGLNDNDYDVWGPRFDGRLLPQYDGKYDPSTTYTTKFGTTVYNGHIEPTPWIVCAVATYQMQTADGADGEAAGQLEDRAGIMRGINIDPL